MQLLRSDRVWSGSFLRPTRDGDTSAHRPEIDGLRAISVLLVIAFHFGMPGVPGGFIGVDVFFVISGYLITDIILREMEEGNFTVIGFYERRIKRIFPALLTMIVVTLAGGVFFLTPGDYATGARSAIRAVLSVSNIFFYKHTGYFDQAAELQPMLHTWSLGVEEQFYLVWPLLLLAIFMMTKGKRQIIAGICACLTFGSFVWGLDLINADPKAAFYLAHARSWELGAGALVAIAPRRWFRCHHLVGEAMLILGLALIIGSGVKFEHLVAVSRGQCTLLGRRSFIYCCALDSFDHDCCRSFSRAIEIDWKDILFALSMALAGPRILQTLLVRCAS